MKIPARYNRLMPYLIIKNASGFQQFMEKVFDAEEQMVVANPDGTVMHGEIKIGDSVIMFAEAGEEFPVMSAGMFIYVANADDAYQKALMTGATAVQGQEPSDKEYGRACGVKDPFGNTWWITSVK